MQAKKTQKKMLPANTNHLEQVLCLCTVDHSGRKYTLEFNCFVAVLQVPPRLFRFTWHFFCLLLSWISLRKRDLTCKQDLV